MTPDNNRTEAIGEAWTDKNDADNTLEVYVPAWLPFTKGKAQALSVQSQIQTSGKLDNYSGSVNTKNTISCRYRNPMTGSGNCPGVRKGEQVVVYKDADTNTYYWYSQGQNDAQHRTDTYRLQISGTLDNSPTLSNDNTYFMEMDTRKGHHIVISTSSADGEAHRYTLQFDADKSKVFLGDEAGNQIEIDSETPRVCMKNKDGSLIDLNTKNITIACTNDITLKTESGNILLQSGADITENAGANMLLTSVGSMTQSATGPWSLSYTGAGSATGHGATMTMTMSKLNINQG